MQPPPASLAEMKLTPWSPPPPLIALPSLPPGLAGVRELVIDGLFGLLLLGCMFIITLNTSTSLLLVLYASIFVNQ